MATAMEEEAMGEAAETVPVVAVEVVAVDDTMVAVDDTMTAAHPPDAAVGVGPLWLQWLDRAVVPDAATAATSTWY